MPRTIRSMDRTEVRSLITKQSPVLVTNAPALASACTVSVFALPEPETSRSHSGSPSSRSTAAACAPIRRSNPPVASVDIGFWGKSITSDGALLSGSPKREQSKVLIVVNLDHHQTRRCRCRPSRGAVRRVPLLEERSDCRRTCAYELTVCRSAAQFSELAHRFSLNHALQERDPRGAAEAIAPFLARHPMRVPA